MAATISGGGSHMAIYLFSGFTEQDLVSTHAINTGQSFTVPGATTHRFRVEDDDGRMSGDTVSGGTSDDRSQTVSIRRGDAHAGSGHVYLDEVYTLQDEAGHQYIMYELEVEGTGEDFYVFQDPPPAPGTHLTVIAREDATAGEVSYDDFAGDDCFGETDREGATVYGGAGDDKIAQGGGSHTSHGGRGDDRLTGGDGDDVLHGGAGDDTLRGNGGADRLHGGDGDDHVAGGAGNDTIHGGRGADTLQGDEGDDLFVFEDDFGNDVIDGGTSRFDTDTDRIDLTGLSRGVEITYKAAETGAIRQGSSTARFEEIERIEASEQSDSIDASAVSSGMAVSGRGGDDKIRGGSGADSLSGGAGEDRIEGGAGDDRITGGAGDDSLSGGAGEDHIDGGTGADAIFGGAGEDKLLGGAGEDRVDGGSGDDRVDLGPRPGEADTLVLSDGGGGDVVFNFEAPVENADGSWTGRDRIDVSGLHDAKGHAVNIWDVTVTAAPDDAADSILSFPNGESLRLVGVSADEIDSPRALIAMGIPSSDGIVRGTSGDDVMTPGWADEDGDRVDSDDAVYGSTTGDEDIIAAGAGNDEVWAGAADDRVSGGTGDDTIHGGAGKDTLHGEAGDDTIHGDAGNDRIYGGAGNDHIETGAGSDTVFGGAGDDVVDDRADTETASRNIILGEDGHDTIMMGAATDWVDAGAGNDTVWGGAGDDLLYGEAGDDVIEGGAGDDEIAGGHGSDRISGGAGDDVIATGGMTDDGIASHDTAHGGGGDDLFMPSADFDNATILGGETDEVKGDTIDLGASHRFAHGATYSSPVRDYRLDLSDADAESGRITDGTGTWTYGEIENLRLGAGTETLRLADGSGDDRVFGFEAPTQAADGSYTAKDLIDVSDMTDADGFRINTDDVTVSDDGAGNARLAFPNGETLTLVGVAPAAVLGPAALAAMGIPRPDGTIDGSAGDDLIDAGYMGDPEGERVDGGDSIAIPGGDDDLIMAGAGNDKVMAGAGDDEAHGGAGDDTLFGGAGGDALHGDAGNDALFGGQGSDRFELADGFGEDSIDGGEDVGGDDRDVIDAGALSSGIDVTYSGDEAGRLASGTDGARFKNIEAIEGSAQADRMDAGASRSGTTLSGGGGDDRLTGGAGDDTLLGGAGHDTITGGRGSDRIEGGAGDDRIHIAHGDAAAGGAGDDLFLFDDEGETDTPDTTVTGGKGFDTLDLRSASRLETLDMTKGPDGWSGSVLMDNGSTMRFSQMERVICFTADTRIATPFGPRRAGDLTVGDLVLTRDHGPRPLRWTGSRRTAATGNCAPIRLRPGVLPGLERDLLVSPQHRMLFEGYRAQLLFGEEEVLIAARHLVDGRDVTVEEGGEVTYVHLLFDAHEIVMAEGAATESFQPGLRGILGLDDASRARLLDTCPGLRAMPDNWGPSARPTLRAHEAKALFA